MSPSKASSRIEVQGHRGARGRMPENSLEAMDYALKVGVDVLELDLGVSKDQVLVLSHDPYIDPEMCLDSKGRKLKEQIPIATLTLREIQSFQCGLLPQKRFPKQKKIKVTIPTLGEVFDLVKSSKYESAKTVRFNIETKIVPGIPDLTPPPAEYAKLLVDLVQKYDLVGRVVVQSFDHRTLRETRKLEPRLRLSPLVENTLLNLTAMAQDLGAEIVSPNHLWITASDVRDLQAIGVQVIPWTANEPREWDRLIEIGVDGIITDYPEELITYLKAKGLR